jgi:beta-phosphoglucomutase-like phosphatase (HAD superfamily)
MNTNIKLIIFDLDGVLIETKELHFKAFNEALDDKYNI